MKRRNMSITTTRKQVGRAGPLDAGPTEAPPNPVPLPDVSELREITIRLSVELAAELVSQAEDAGRTVDAHVDVLLKRGMGLR
jgi:hypothetical protein